MTKGRWIFGRGKAVMEDRPTVGAEADLPEPAKDVGDAVDSVTLARLLEEVRNVDAAP